MGELRRRGVITRQQTQGVSTIHAPAGRVHPPTNMIRQCLRHDRQLVHVVVCEQRAWQTRPFKPFKVLCRADFLPADEQFTHAGLFFPGRCRHVADEPVKQLLVGGDFVDVLKRHQEQKMQQIDKQLAASGSGACVKEANIEFFRDRDHLFSVVKVHVRGHFHVIDLAILLE